MYSETENDNSVPSASQLLLIKLITSFHFTYFCIVCLYLNMVNCFESEIKVYSLWQIINSFLKILFDVLITSFVNYTPKFAFH